MSTYAGNPALPYVSLSLPDDLVSARAVASINPAFQALQDRVRRVQNQLPARLSGANLSPGTTLSNGAMASIASVAILPDTYLDGDVTFEIACTLQYNATANTGFGRVEMYIRLLDSLVVVDQSITFRGYAEGAAMVNGFHQVTGLYAVTVASLPTDIVVYARNTGTSAGVEIEDISVSGVYWHA